MMSLIEAARTPDYPAEIAIVISNRPEAPGLELARAAGIAALVIDHRQFPSRGPFEMKLHGALMDQHVDLVCNAGFMRMFTDTFVDRWRDRHLNIHPSLLPAFPGLNVHQRVLEGGVMITGCTVHFVRVEMDAGPILAQAAVPVLPNDSPKLLAARVLKVEHRLYPHAVRLVASGATRIVREKVALDPFSCDPPSLIWPPVESG
jgi:phosphoribosylglycinamide formyltransferase-1